MVIPCFTAGAVLLTITQLLLLKAAHAANPPPPDETSLVYISEYAMAILCLISGERGRAGGAEGVLSSSMGQEKDGALPSRVQIHAYRVFSPSDPCPLTPPRS